jgi:hypothetical protein
MLLKNLNEGKILALRKSLKAFDSGYSMEKLSYGNKTAYKVFMPTAKLYFTLEVVQSGMLLTYPMDAMMCNGKNWAILSDMLKNFGKKKDELE